jgi:hypothetical protein
VIPILDAFKSKEWVRPNQEIDPQKKDKAYHQRNAEFIYSLYCRDKCAWGINGYNKFNELRAYSRGNQSTDRYKVWAVNDFSTAGSSTTPVALDTFDDLPLTRLAKKYG